jgi:hypothetical protein
MGWATFWAILSQTHLVTLALHQNRPLNGEAIEGDAFFTFQTEKVERGLLTADCL